jgi:hypothetical protein
MIAAGRYSQTRALIQGTEEPFPRLALSVEIITLVFAGWTLAYHAVLLIRAPAYTAFSAAAVATLAVFWSARKRIGKHSQQPVSRKVYVGVAALAISAALFTMFHCLENGDDLSVFRSPLVQDLSKAYDLHDTQHGVPGLPPLSVLHLMTSFEPLMAGTARLTHTDPLWLYQNGAGAAAAALLVMTLFLTYVEIGIDAGAAVACTASALLFLIIDGNTLASFGNSSLARFWQGKAILWSLVLPMTLLFLVRWLHSPEWWRLAVLIAVGISSVGMGTSAVFQVPMLAAAGVIAALCARALNRSAHDAHGLTTAAAGALAASLYPGMIAVALAMHILPQPDMAPWLEGIPHWWGNLCWVLGDNWCVIRDAVLLLALPAVVLRGWGRWFVLALSLALIALFANPVMGPALIGVIQPGAFWRLSYLFPVPFCAGLVALMLRKPRGAGGAVSLAVAAITMVAILAAFRHSVLAGAEWKSPVDYRFFAAERSFCRLIRDRVRTRRVLAPEPLIRALLLMAPDAWCIACRMGGTLHAFRSAGREEEGWIRVRAQYVVTRGDAAPIHRAAVRDVLAMGTDAIVTYPHTEAFLIQLLQSLDPQRQWKRSAATRDYVLLLPD